MSDSTDPPAMPGQSADDTGRWILEKVKKAREDSREALDLSRENASSLSKLVDVIGVSTNQALGTPGTGLLGAFDRLCIRVEQLALKVDQLAAEFHASRQEAEKRRSAWVWGLKIALSTIIVAATGSGIAWVVSLHH